MEFAEFLEDIRLERTPSAGLADGARSSGHCRRDLPTIWIPLLRFVGGLGRLKMIITRSPLRITLGGGAPTCLRTIVSTAALLIAAAIDKYVYVTVTRPFVEGIFLKYSKLEHVKAVDDVQHPIIREAIRMLGFSTPRIEITTLADIPAGTGLGSSGSFSTALLRALCAYQRRLLHPHELAELACEIEINRLGEPDRQAGSVHSLIWWCDMFYLSSGRSRRGLPAEAEQRVSDGLEDSLLLFFTGFSRSAGSILKDQKARTELSDGEMLENLHYVKELGLSQPAGARERQYDAVWRIDGRALAAQEAPVWRYEQFLDRPVVRAGTPQWRHRRKTRRSRRRRVPALLH